MKQNKKAITKEYFDETKEDASINPKYLEQVFTEEKYYLSMKPLPLEEKEVLYYSIVKEYSLKEICKKMNISRKQVNELKNKAIADFKENLRKICGGKIDE